MKVLVVLDHPCTIVSAENVPHQRSFSAAVAAAAIRGARSAGHEVDLIDLAADGFAPAMTGADLAAWRLGRVVDPLVADYQRRLLAAGHLTFVYEELPQARGNPFRNRMTSLGGVSVLSVMTTPDKAYRWWYRDPLTKILFKGTFAKIGVRNLRWTNYASVTAKTPEQRARMLQQTEQAFAAL